MYRAVSLIICAATTFVVLLASGCSPDQNADTDTDQSQNGAGSGSRRVLPQGGKPVNLDSSNFTTRIDNTYWPMVPGTRWTYHETDQDGGEQQVIVTVSDRTRKIANGIAARVVRDTVTEKGKIIEDTYDYYAQDEDGNLWYLGEDTAEFENGEIKTREGSFEAGVDGAQAGVIMPAAPQDGMKYRQEYYKGEAEDNGEILSANELVEVPFGQFDQAVLTKDTIAIEPNVLEYKLYAKGIGPVLTLGVSGGPGSREELTELSNASEKWTRKAGTAPLGEGPVSPAKP